MAETNWRAVPPLAEMTFYGVLDRYRVGVINDHGANSTRETNRAMNDAKDELCMRWAKLEGDNARLVARVVELEDEVRVDDKLLDERNETLALIPDCPDHGRACQPHYREWIRTRLSEQPRPPSDV